MLLWNLALSCRINKLSTRSWQFFRALVGLALMHLERRLGSG